MTSPQDGPVPVKGVSMRLCRLMAGLDVGVAGGMAVLLWFAIHSRMSGEFWWSKLNVAGALFYGANVYSMGLGKATLAGTSLLLVVYAGASAAFSQFAPATGYARNALLAVLYATALHLAANRFFWPRLDPFAPSFFAVPVTLAGNLLYALSLTRFPGRFRALAATFGDSSWSGALLVRRPQIVGPPEGAAEARSAPEDAAGAAARPESQPPPEPPADPPAPYC